MPASLDEARTGNSTADLKQAILDNLYYIQGRIPALATPTDWYMEPMSSDSGWWS